MIDSKKYLYSKQIETIYAQSITAAIGNTLSALLIVYIFSSSVVMWKLWTLFGIITFFSIARIFIYKAYKRDVNEEKIVFFGNVYVLISLISSSVWGVFWFVLIPTTQPVHLAIVGMWVMGMSAAPAISYAVYLKSLFAYFLPITISGIAAFLYIGGPYATPIALVLVIYTFVLIRGSIPVNKSIIDSILLNLKLKVEIKEREKIQKELEELSIKDGLTGLFNRRFFDETLKFELHSAQRSAYELSLIMIDIDYFKAYNDNYGHLEGDDCLKIITKNIKLSAKRYGDIVCRYGGEEFAIILPRTSSQNAYKIAQEIKKSVLALEIEHKYSEIDDINFITLSFGVGTIVPIKDTKMEEIIYLADKALYEAKNSGRNRVTVLK